MRRRLLVSDVIMPGMNGPELAQKICEARPELPALFISGFARDVIEERGIDSSINLLVKPFSPEELVERVRDLLASAAARQKQIPRKTGCPGSKARACQPA